MSALSQPLTHLPIGHQSTGPGWSVTLAWNEANGPGAWTVVAVSDRGVWFESITDVDVAKVAYEGWVARFRRGA